MSQIRLLFGGVVFLAAFLLFLVEPMAAKQLLPQLGGSAAVWITCLVYFQTALLVGYLYAHWLSTRKHSVGYWILLVIGVASAIAWAVHPFESTNGAVHPISTIFGVLSISIGIPFILLSATSPLMQVWWVRFERSEVPYRLYALSNLASLLALAAYPSLIEPNLTLRTQRVVWSCDFIVFALLSGYISLKTRTEAVGATREPSEEKDSSPSPLFAKALWVLLPMAAAMQLSAITSHLTANIAAIPLLWILPLAVYLFTLILAFQFPRLLSHGILARLLVLVLASVAYMLAQVDHSWPIWLSIPFFLIALFVTCLFCHVEACALRPRRSSEATLFYLLFAAGGALGSFWIGIAAPLLFRFNCDLPITFFLTALLALIATWRTYWTHRLLWAACSIVMLVVVFMVRIAYERKTTVAVRNFYGSLRVTQDESTFPGATLRTLLNGSIQHGTQIFGTNEQRHTPTTYYSGDSGVGLAIRFCCEERSRNIGVVGLGAGTIAAYGRPGDRIRFYEINPADIPIARNVFRYIRDSGAQIEIVEGDARTSLAQEPPQKFDVLVVDAFSGDAIPLHLLTKEALALYRRHLAPDGILAFHISNQHVNLGPPIALLATSAGMQARRVSSLSNEARGEFSSTWMLVSDNAAFFAHPEVTAHTVLPEIQPGLYVWTDDYSALLPVMRW